MSDGLNRSKLPMPYPPFSGSLGRMIGDSAPGWGIIGDAALPEGAPNILLVLIDDAGLGSRRLSAAQLPRRTARGWRRAA